MILTFANGAKCLASLKRPLRMLEDYCLIQPIRDWRHVYTDDLLVIPPQADMNKVLFVGLIVATGPGDKLKDGRRAPMHVKPGDMILYPHRSGMLGGGEFQVDGETYIKLHEEQWMVAVCDNADVKRNEMASPAS